MSFETILTLSALFLNGQIALAVGRCDPSRDQTVSHSYEMKATANGQNYFRQHVFKISKEWSHRRKLTMWKTKMLSHPKVRKAFDLANDPDTLLSLPDGAYSPKRIFSPFLLNWKIEGTESRFLKSNLVEDGHCGYFGSNSDLFRLAHDFPGARHYHLFDILDYGYTATKAETLQEIESAARALSSDGKLELISPGFLIHVPIEVMNQPNEGRIKNYFKENLPLNKNLRKPLIYKINVRLSDSLEEVRMVYFHPVDFSDIEQVRELLSSLPNDGRLQGFLWAGATLPDNKLITLEIAEKLKRNKGVFIYEGEMKSNKKVPLFTFSNEQDQRREIEIVDAVSYFGVHVSKVKTGEVYEGAKVPLVFQF